MRDVAAQPVQQVMAQQVRGRVGAVVVEAAGEEDGLLPGQLEVPARREAEVRSAKYTRRPSVSSDRCVPTAT
ncbi:hypothetical protein [Streptomyces sp. NPDC053367]|uniref:hypothetical protein n=1 Tax=Streptomyces sp. NPDC053367 TaxID=3365700 RepID=UPI0037D01216